jgi:hypothetical protein
LKKIVVVGFFLNFEFFQRTQAQVFAINTGWVIKESMMEKSWKNEKLATL